MRRSTLADYAYFVVEGSGLKVTLPRGASDAAIAPCHFERSNRSPDAREDASQNRGGSNEELPLAGCVDRSVMKHGHWMT
jgi:hypothetical protein